MIFKGASGEGGMRIIAAFVIGAVVGAFSAVEVIPNSPADRTGQAIATDGSAGDAGDLGGGGPVPGAPGEGLSPVDGGTTAGPAGGQAGGAEASTPCSAANNGGATDRGISANEIRMTTTVVESGIGSAFLRDVRFAMEAVRNEINRGGGICGRRLVIDYIDDGWDAQRGAQFIRNFANQTFSIPIGPSSEGLRIVIHSGDIDRAKLPVIGADGMLIDQYVKETGATQPWVWPVSVATVASARIMIRNAHKQGVRRFGIVFDKNYRFGQEAAKAFNAEVKRLTGNDVDGYNDDNNCVRSFCGILAGQSSYSNEVREFYGVGGAKRMEFVALFLEPQTALTWMADPNTPAASSLRHEGAQPLFTRDFAVNCQAKCDQMMVWTGFKPPIEGYKTDPAVRRYVTDLERTNPQADEFNAFVIGAYVGMRQLEKALRAVGANLTRERLRAVLNTMTLEAGLTIQPRLEWRPDWRWVNTTMQGFTIQYKGTFAGWRTGPIERDPRPAAGVN